MKRNCVDESASCWGVWTSAKFAQKWKMTAVSVAASAALKLVESVVLALIALATGTFAMVQKHLKSSVAAAAPGALAPPSAVTSAARLSIAQKIAYISKATANSTQTQQLGTTAIIPTSVHSQTSLAL